MPDILIPYWQRRTLPQLPSKLPPQITAVPVNNPPFTNFGRTAILASIIALSQPPVPSPFMGNTQPLEARSLPPQISAVTSNNPTPNADEDVNLQIIQQWQPDAWPYIFEGRQGRLQPYAPAKLPPQIMAVPVNDPPFGHMGRDAYIISETAALNQPPDWPYVFIAERGRLQPYGPGLLSPGIPGQSVDIPPFAGADEFDQIVAMITVAWRAPDPQPTLPGKLSPGIPGQSIDRPPPVHQERQSDQLQASIALSQPSTWVYSFQGGKQPYEPRRLTVGIPGVSVDNPPGLRPSFLLPWPPDAPLPTLGRLIPQPFVAAGQNPYTPAWLPILLSAWQAPDPLPTLPRVLNAGLLAVPVNNPPFSHRERIALHANIVDANQPPPPWPFIGGTGPLMPYRSVFGVRVDNPPFTHWGRIAITVQIVSMMQPPDPQPFMGGRQPLEPAKLNPSITAVAVNNPPFGSRTHLPNILKSWEDPPPPPWFHNLYVQPAVTYVPYSQEWLPGILTSWLEPVRLPDLPRKLSPGIPGQSIDNPPQLRVRVDWPSWEVQPSPQVQRPYARIETSGQPFLAQGTATAILAWMPIDYRIEPQRKLPPQIIVGNPPFSHRGRLAYLPNVLLTWQAPDPLPTPARKLPPQITAVAVNNPPFDMRGHSLPSIIQMWQPEPFVFRPPYVPTARFIQPFLGHRIIAKPTLIAQDFQSNIKGVDASPSLSGQDAAITLKGKVES